MLFPVLAVPLVLLVWPSLAQQLTPPTVALSSTSGTGSSTSSSASRTLSASGTSVANASGSVNATATPTPSATNFPSLSGYSPCVSNCLAISVAAVGCDSLTDVQCFCTNATRFSRSLVDCITPQCPGDLTNAETVSGQFCDLASPNVSLSFPPPTSTPSATNSSTSSSTSSTSASTSATTPAAPTQSSSGALGLTMDSLALRGALAVGLGSAIAAFALGS